MKKLALIACCLLVCLMATQAMAANEVRVASRTFASGQTACTLGVFIENDEPLTGMVIPLEIRTQSGDAFYLGALVGVTWNYMPTGRLKNSPLGDVAEPNGLWPAANVTRRQYAKPVPLDSACSGPVSRSYSTQALRGDTISPDAFFLATVSTGDPSIGEEISLQPGTDGATPSMRVLISLTPGTNGCMVIDTACITPANHIFFVNENNQGITPNFIRGEITVGSGSCAVVANQPPTAVCENVTVYADGNCEGTVTPSELDPNVQSSDPEDGFSITYSMFPSPPFAVGQHVVNLVVTDSQGAADTCQSILTVADTTKPTITCPGPISVQCNADIPEPYNSAGFLAAGGTLSDNCGLGTFELMGTNDVGTCPRTITRTYRIFDASGNSATCTQTITVDDTQAPENFVCENDTIIPVPFGTPGQIVNYSGIAAFSDNCDPSVTITYNPPSGTLFATNEAPHHVWVYGTDDCGNVDSCSFIVFIDEQPAGNTPPTAVCQNIQVDADANCQGTAVAADVDNGSNDPDGTIANMYLSPAGPYPIGINGVWLVVVDNNGAIDSCNAQITVEDNTAPEVTCPDTVVVACFDEIPPALTDVTGFLAAGGTITDNCPGPFNLNWTGQAPVGDECTGSFAYGYIISDASGNEQGCWQVFLIRDTIKPELAPCPSNINVLVSSGTVDTVIDYAPVSATDNCDQQVYVEYSHPSGTAFPVGQTTVTVFAEDNCGNRDSCQFLVTVTVQEEDAPPVAICTDVTVSVTDPSNCWADASIDNGSYDPDGGDPVLLSQNPAGPYPLGSTLVLLTVTDDEGDSDTCSAWVNVEDNTAPTLTCPDDIVVDNDPGQCGAVVNYDPAQVFDVCDEDPIVTYSVASGSFFPVGTTTVKVVATDADGNADSCYFDITVHDTENPTAWCFADTVVLSNDPGECGAVSNFLFNGVGSTDNCEIESSVYAPPAGSFFPVGTTAVKHVVIDPSGNADSCYFYIRVEDTTRPTITCPDDIKVNAPFGQSTAVVNYAGPAVDDNCGIEYTLCVPPSGSSFPIGQTVVACTTWDVWGNAAWCEFTVTVNEGSQEAPGPHVDVEQLEFKTTCECDTQYVSVYCVDVDTDSCWYLAVTDVPGISIVPNPGWAPREVAIIACGDGLYPDTYAGWVFFHDAPGNRTDSFYVYHQVNFDTPGIAVSPDTLKFTYTGDIWNDKLCLPASIASVGCVERCWTLVGGTGDWVFVDPTSGTTPDIFEVCVNPCDLEEGVYYQTLEFCMCASKGEDDPKPVPSCDQLVVQLTVSNPPVMAVDPLNLYFELNCGQKANPLPVEVSNTGGGVLDWYAWTNANWIIINPNQGTALDTFFVNIDIDSLKCPEECKVLVDSICVTGNKGCAQNSPQWVRVELRLCPPDSSVCDSICGEIVDANCFSKTYCHIEGATVELWDSYPDGTILETTTSDSDGKFCFHGFEGTFDVRVYKKGFCTEVWDDVTCEDGHLTLPLNPLDFSPLPNWPYFTDYSSINAQFVFDGLPYLILPGDVIYATDPDGVICGVTYVGADSAGKYLIHVLGDDPKTPQDEGAVFGDQITLWLNCDCPVTAPDTWVNFGDYVFDALWDCEDVPLCCDLCEGWNMWSYNRILPDDAREAVLASIDLSYNAVRSGRCDYGSISWYANRELNDLFNMPPQFGYDIRLTEDATICIEGELIDPTTPIYLCQGWNYIPYWPNESDNLQHALESLQGNYSFIFTMYCGYGVASWSEIREPQNNDLWCMDPCKGYWINMKSEDTLIYPAEVEGCQTLSKVGANASTGRVKATPMVADYYAPYSTLIPGSVISVRNTSGGLVGESYVGENGAYLIHVYGDVPNTSDVEGAVYGEELTFEVNGMAASAGREIVWSDRDNQEIALTVDASGTIPTEYALLQNYPNPFNAGTVMPFVMKDAAQWTLTVYNIMGQTVRSFEGFDAAGTVRVTWNGLDQNGSTVPSGVYFYRVTTAEWSATKKMTLLK